MSTGGTTAATTGSLSVLSQNNRRSRVSYGYSRPCYVLKLDIRGYFMHINRERLLEIWLRSLEPFRAKGKLA